MTLETEKDYGAQDVKLGLTGMGLIVLAALIITLLA
jgi:hypothetical protein